MGHGGADGGESVGAGSGRPTPTAWALSRLAAGAGSAAVLVAGALVTRELWGPARSALSTGEGGLDSLGLIALPMFWAVAAALVWYLVLPTWRGLRWARRVWGASCFAVCAGALHWLSYEPVPGSGSWVVGITVALLSASAAAAAVLAERVEHRLGRLGGAGAVLGAAALVIGSVIALDGSCDAHVEVDYAIPSGGGEPSATAAVQRFAEHERGQPLHVPASGWRLVSAGQSRATYEAEDVRATVLRLEDDTWVVAQAGCIRGHVP